MAQLNIIESEELKSLQLKIDGLESEKKKIQASFENKIRTKPVSEGELQVPRMEFGLREGQLKLTCFRKFNCTLLSQFSYSCDSISYNYVTLPPMDGNKVIEVLNIYKESFFNQMYCTAIYLEKLYNDGNRDFLNEKNVVILGFAQSKENGNEFHAFFLRIKNGVPVLNSEPITRGFDTSIIVIF